MTKFYILSEDHQLVPVDLLTWAEWFEKDFNRSIAYDEVDGVRISTVFLGFDQGFRGQGLFFETMVFLNNGDQIQRRWHTYDEAIEGHRRLAMRQTVESAG